MAKKQKYQPQGMGLAEPGANRNPNATTSTKNPDVVNPNKNTGQLDTAIGQGPDASYVQFTKQRAADLATKIQQQKTQQVQQRQQQQVQAKQAAQQKAKQPSLAQKLVGYVKQVPAAAVSSEQAVAKPIARLLPGGQNDLKAENEQIDENLQLTQQINKLRQSSNPKDQLEAQRLGKLSKENIANTTKNVNETTKEIKADTNPGRIIAGAAGTAADILTAGTLPKIKAGGELATKLVGHAITGGGYATDAALNAAASGGNKKQVAENAVAGALLPGGLHVLGKTVGKGAEAAKVVAGKDEGMNNLITRAKVGQVKGRMSLGNAAVKGAEEPADMIDQPKAAPVVNAQVNKDLVDKGLVKPAINHVQATNLKLGADTLGTELDKNTVAKYKSDIEAGKPVEPVVVTHEKGGTYVQDGKHRLEAMKQAGVEDIPTVERATATKPAEPKQLTPDETKSMEPVSGYTHSSQLVQDYADMMHGLESHAKGGQMIPNGEGGYIRTSEHGQFYRDYFKEHGSAPPASAYTEEAEKQLSQGHGAYGASEDYQALKDRETPKVQGAGVAPAPTTSGDINTGDAVAFHKVEQGKVTGVEDKTYTVHGVNSDGKLELHDSEGKSLWTTPDSVEKVGGSSADKEPLPGQENSPEAEKLWEEKYAPEAEVLDNQANKLTEELKTAKAVDRPGIRARLDKVNNLAAVHEENFLKEAKSAVPTPTPPTPPTNNFAGNKNVEMVPTEEAAKYMEHDRASSPLMSSENYQKLKDDIAKNGIKEPLILNYGATDKIAALGEGNHRLAIARELGIKEVPVEVSGTRLSKADQVADKKGFASVSGREPDRFGYVPSNQKPSDIGVQVTKELPENEPVATPPKVPNPLGEAGGVTPGAPIADLKKFMDETKKAGQAGGDLSDKLHALSGESTADKVALTKFLKTTQHLKSKDLEAAYHYSEDKTSPVTADQRDIFEKYVKPLQDETQAARERLGKQGVMVGSDHMHRIVRGKGDSLEQFIKGERPNPVGGGKLRKTTPSMKSRTMKVLTDDNGNRTVVAIKTPKDKLGMAKGSPRVTSFKNGAPEDMGLRKVNVPPKATEFYDPKQMAALNDVAEKLGIKHERTNEPLKRGDTAAGISTPGGGIRTRVGSPADTLLHEIGHQLDDKYDLQKEFGVRYNKELRALADERLGGAGENKTFSKYIRKGSEKVAVMFQAYLHAPEIFKRVAPDTYKAFTTFLGEHDELKPILNIEKSLAMEKNTVGESIRPDEFVDKNGKHYTVGEATTKEIEDNTKLRYYKNPIVNSSLDYLQTRAAERANNFLNAWKTSEGFSDIAVKQGEGEVPHGWTTTKAPQFMGYYFTPKVAHVLDDFAGMAHDDPLRALSSMNRFLRTTIFFNPLIHIPNVVMHWLPNRGASNWINPLGYVRLGKTGIKAINDVVHQNKEYQDMLREGAPLLSFDQEKFADQIGKMMDASLEDENTARKVASALGYADPRQLVKAWYNFSHKVTWASNDILTLQAIFEEKAKGVSTAEAIARTGKHIPDYRMPAEIAGNRALKQILSNPNLTMFSSYHYGVLKNYATMVRDLIGKDASIKDRAGAIDKMIMAGVTALVIYPLLDQVAQKISGSPNARFKRAGAFALPDAIAQVVQGRKTPGQVASGVVTPAPGTRGALQLIQNKDAFGNQIYDPADVVHPKQLGKDIGEFSASLISPVSQGQKIATGKTSGKDFLVGLLGIQSPKSDLQVQLNKTVQEQFGDTGITKAQQKIIKEKADARDQIANGKGDGKAKALVDEGIISAATFKKFKASAKWTPQQRAFDSLTVENKLKILQQASPQDRASLVGDMKGLKTQLTKQVKNKSTKPANQAAAQDILKILGGDNNSANYNYDDGEKATHQGILQSVAAYASAFKTSPATAFNRIFTGQRIVRTNNGAIIVQRLPVGASQGIKGQLGGKNKTMKLDHTIPLELGGSNDKSNLKLVTTDTWASYTPVEDYLGKQLRANKINAKQAQQKIIAFKTGKLKASQIIGH